MNILLSRIPSAIGVASLLFFSACSSRKTASTPVTQSSPVTTTPALGNIAGTVALLDASGNPVASIAIGSPAQLCVTLTAVQSDETYYKITQQNGVALTSPPQFTISQSGCTTVIYATAIASRTDNVTLAAFGTDGTQKETLTLTTTGFAVVTALPGSLSCLATASTSPNYISVDASGKLNAGARSTAIGITVDCGSSNGSVSVSSLPAGFKTTANGSPAVGADGKIHLMGNVAASGTVTLDFLIAGTQSRAADAMVTVNVNGAAPFACTLNQGANPLTLTGNVTQLETYTVVFANRNPQSISASSPGGGFTSPIIFKPVGNSTLPNQTSTYSFSGTYSALGSFAMKVTAGDPIFAGQTTSCTTDAATMVKAPVPAGPPPVTCSVLTISPSIFTIPVDAYNNITGQSTTANYTIQLNESGKIGTIPVPTGAVVTPPVAGANNTFTLSANFRGTGNQVLNIPVTDLNATSSATCSPTINVVPVIHWDPLVCTVTADPGSVVIQLDANANPVTRTQGLKFTVRTNREGASWYTTTGGGNFSAGGLLASGTGFVYSGSFFAPPGNYAVTAELNDSKIPGAGVTRCTTATPVNVVGRPPITCTIYPDFASLLIPVDAANRPLGQSQQTGVTIVSSYPSVLPKVWGTGNMANVVAPFAADNTWQKFRVAVNFGATTPQTIEAAVTEPNGASGATCTAQVSVNAFGPGARVNPTGVMGPNQYLCSPSYSLLCWNSIFSPDGQYRLDMQSDGNLVLYAVASNNLPVWASNTAGSGAAYALMDPGSGNLILRDANGGVKWVSGGAQAANASLSVQTDANLVIYQSGVAKWASATNGWWRNNNLLYKNGTVNCTGTPRNPAAAGINSCIALTPNGWTMLLDADTYVIENGAPVVLNKSMTLSTAGGWGNPTPCFNVPVQNNPDAGTQWTGVGCAQLLADTNSHFAWGGFVIMGHPNGKINPDSQNYPIPGFDVISNVNIDHININGNYINRYASTPIGSFFQSNMESVNASAINCTSCSFKNSGTQFSLSGGLALQYNTDGFVADHDSFYWHGNLKEQRNGAQYPRHGGCAIVQGANLRFTNNFIRHCADESVLIGGSPNGFVNNNVFYERDNDYSSTEIRVQTEVSQKGLKVTYNAIDCSDGECSTGITVGSDQFTAALSPASGYLYSGLNGDGVQILSNIISGAHIGIMVGFRPVPGHAVYIAGNAISPYQFGQPFQPMACKQWFGTRPDYTCCSPTWYNVPMPNWPYPNTGLTMGWGGNPVVGTTIMIDPSDWLQTLKDYNGTQFIPGVEAYSASWKGAGGGMDDTRSCF